MLISHSALPVKHRMMSVPKMLLRVLLWTACFGVVVCSDVLEAQVNPKTFAETDPETSTKSEELQFSFDRAPWREVIKWLADSADLALHIGDYPTGSFTYFDNNQFTPQEAIERVNLFLVPEGYTLVRSGKLLSLIDFSDPVSTQQLNALARLVSTEELESLNDFDVAKCIFRLESFDAADAVEELSPLSLMTTPSVFQKTNQLMITDTVAKLKSVKQILDAFEPGVLENGTVVKSFALKHVSAEDVLTVARPHLGLATGEMIGIDVSLSADPQGKHLFVTGVEDKVKVIEGLIASIDLPDQKSTGLDQEAKLETYVVEGENVETIYSVLQTLLAGKDIRLSADAEASSIVALATPEVQAEIAATIDQLQENIADFEIIPLKTIDPYFAVSLLEEMLDITDPLFADEDDEKSESPRIDADPANMRLFVRGRKHQIEEIKKIIAGLDSGNKAVADESHDLRVIPLKGSQAEQALKTAVAFWRRGNPVFLFPSQDRLDSVETERVVSAEPAPDSEYFVSSRFNTPASAKLLTSDADTEKPAIRCQVTGRGLLMQSEDTEALDQLEELLRTVNGPVDLTPSPPIVFYLKYTKAPDAIRMLAELMDGGQMVKDGEAGSLVNAYVSAASDSFLGSIVTSRDGTLTMMAGSMTVVADPRLNRLIAQGTTTDIAEIEEYLKIIDKDNSLTSIETYGTSKVIELSHAKATEVAASIREAYAGRVAASTSASGANGQQRTGNQPQKPGQNPQGNDPKKEGNEKKGEQAPKGKSQSQPTRDLEPKMTVAVHEPSNSLIVTAPQQLLDEVEKLAMTIDARSRRGVRIMTVQDGAVVDSVQQIFGFGSSSTSGNRTISPPSAKTSKTSKNSDRSKSSITK